MTRKEWMKIHYPNDVSDNHWGGVFGCPYLHHALVDIEPSSSVDSLHHCDHDCTKCWNAEIKGENEMDKVYDPEYLAHNVVTKQDEKPVKEVLREFIAKSIQTADEYQQATQSLDDSPRILDSGDRTEFETGAVRDMHSGKGDMVSIPWEAILRLSIHYENGANKYERWNFRKGIPVSSFIDSACRHLAKYQCGCDDEDHLAAAAFNVLGAMLMENTKPEMVDLPLRKGKNTFDYFKKENSDEHH